MARPTRSASATPPLLRIAVTVGEAAAAERAAAEAYAAGAVGLEEREEGSEITLLLYAPAPRARAVRRAVADALGAGARVGEPAETEATDWSEAWKAGLEPVVISARLRIRPSFVASPRAPGQAELVIDPGQAFGTGGHASTRLALEWIDALAPVLERGGRCLDVGTGTGILALAALRLGCSRALVLDTDALAVETACRNARANDLGARLLPYVGSLDALGDAGFELVVANLLGSELAPLLGEIARRTQSGGHAVFSGVLTRECAAFGDALGRAGLRTLGARERSDADGVAWAALLTTR